MAPTQVASEQVAEREHIRAEAQLKVDGGRQVARTAALANRRGSGQVWPHRLLNEDGTACGKLRQDSENLIARDGKVVDHVLARGRGIEAREDSLNREFVCDGVRSVHARVVEAGDFQAERAIRRQVARARFRRHQSPRSDVGGTVAAIAGETASCS